MDGPSRPRKLRYDVVVVGARCGGAATAMLMARRGLRVLCVDRSRYGSDTLSTHAIMRPGVLQLARWGLLDGLRQAGTPTIRTTSFRYGDEAITIPIKPRDGVDGLYSPRRTVLDALLADAAAESGVEMLRGVRLTGLRRDRTGRACGVELVDDAGLPFTVHAGWTVGADGMRSTVAGLAGARTTHEAPTSTASIYGYYPLVDNGNRWFYRPGVSAGAIPTNDGLSCVFSSQPVERFQREAPENLEALFAAIVSESDPGLGEEVATSRREGKLFAFPGLPGYMRQCHGPGWALVGDAGYFKDPLTAHGITDALRDAELLARAVAQDRPGALADYQAIRDELALDLFEITSRVASFRWDLPELQRLHLQLSEAMSREGKFMATLDPDENSLPTPSDPARRAC